ncbi:MAG: hypothetical protein JNM94_17955 [Phycisphaerae bacterium]|nr:hypothetical protein [Phycisphaerae bacterium]
MRLVGFLLGAVVATVVVARVTAKVEGSVGSRRYSWAVGGDVAYLYTLGNGIAAASVPGQLVLARRDELQVLDTGYQLELRAWRLAPDLFNYQLFVPYAMLYAVAPIAILGGVIGATLIRAPFRFRRWRRTRRGRCDACGYPLVVAGATVSPEAEPSDER